MAGPRKQSPLGRIRSIHMVGIGGIGMSSIAEVLLGLGFNVTGSDMTRSDVTKRLEGLGAEIFEGHVAKNIGAADVVVYSSAVRPTVNPETREAERRHIPLIRRADMLGELMRMKYGICIAGTHGKTTTTSLTGMVVTEGGFDPTIIVGGKITVFGSNAVTGKGDIIIIEADEYDRTFLRLTPSIAVVTNIEADHLDIYKDLDDIRSAFIQFANSVPFYGAAILCLDDAMIREILNEIDRRIITYGTSRQATVRAEQIRFEGTNTKFCVLFEDEMLGELSLQVPGMHNVANALAAVAVGLELEMPFESIRSGLDKFSGVQRRFEMKGGAGDVLVIDDYAHHPTEIEATLRAANESWPNRRLIAVFQPHLYSRTRDFMEDFARSFFDADVLVLTEIYGAREESISGVTGKALAELTVRYGHRNVHYVEEKEMLPDYLLHLARPGDIVLTLGAGDVWNCGEMFLTKMQEVES